MNIKIIGAKVEEVEYVGKIAYDCVLKVELPPPFKYQGCKLHIPFSEAQFAEGVANEILEYLKKEGEQ